MTEYTDNWVSSCTVAEYSHYCPGGHGKVAMIEHGLRCPNCGSDDQAKLRIFSKGLGARGKWIPWWPSEQACKDPWHFRGKGDD